MTYSSSLYPAVASLGYWIGVRAPYMPETSPSDVPPMAYGCGYALLQYPWDFAPCPRPITPGPRPLTRQYSSLGRR